MKNGWGSWNPQNLEDVGSSGNDKMIPKYLANISVTQETGILPTKTLSSPLTHHRPQCGFSSLNILKCFPFQIPTMARSKTYSSVLIHLLFKQHVFPYTWWFLSSCFHSMEPIKLTILNHLKYVACNTCFLLYCSFPLLAIHIHYLIIPIMESENI